MKGRDSKREGPKRGVGRLHRLTSLVLASAGVLILVIGAAQAPGSSDSWTRDQWRAWRDRGIAYIFEPTLDVGGEKVLSRRTVSKRCAEVYGEIEATLRREPAALASREVANFVSFLEAQRMMSAETKEGGHPNALGYKVSDLDYWRTSAEYSEIPEFLRSQAFLSKTMDPVTYRAAVRMIEDHNSTLPPDRRLVALPYKAQFILSVDRTTYGRLLVLAPNERAPDGSLVDKWMLFAMATPDQDSAPLPYSVSMVAVKHGEGRSQAYFLDYMRVPNLKTGAIELLPSVTLPNSPSANCYDCHKSAVIPIHPELEYTFDTEGGLTPKKSGSGFITGIVNSRIRTYGEVARGPQDTASYGPSLGQERERSEAFILEAAGDLKLGLGSVPRIREAMNCASCHESFAPINYPEAMRTDRDAIAVKTGIGIAQTFVEEGLMPPGNTLSPVERKALWRCLTKEYMDRGEGAFIQWLRGQ